MEPKDEKEQILTLVKTKYSEIARGKPFERTASCCGGSSPFTTIMDRGKILDYTEKDLAVAPGEANLGLGCGNPIARAGLKPGEVVLDVGSGAGFDAFLSAAQVGESGKVIGIDMTPEMVEKARANAQRLNITHAEFRLGEIEKLPVETGSVDVVISNCVINLSPDKSAVFAEIHRTLKPGGRIVISDVLRSGEIPEDIKNNPAAYTG